MRVSAQYQWVTCSSCGREAAVCDSALELREWDWFVSTSFEEMVCPNCRVHRLPYVHAEDSVYGVVSVALSEGISTPEAMEAILPGKICPRCGEYNEDGDSCCEEEED